LRRRLIAGRFDRIYDLQTSARSNRYFGLLPRRARPEWSGIARGCSHPDSDPARDRRHDIDRQRGQLATAGVAVMPDADLSWCAGDVARFSLPDRFVLLVPGSAPHRPDKRWPAANFQVLARGLTERGLVPVVVGGTDARDLGRAIRDSAPGALDLTGQTTLDELAALARRATLAVGNDTGPMHLVAAAGCRAVVLFSRASDPALCAPRGTGVTVLRQPNLADLSPEDVIAAMQNVLGMF
jgi:ADP-heptose:LPS heptosyltransferase